MAGEGKDWTLLRRQSGQQLRRSVGLSVYLLPALNNGESRYTHKSPEYAKIISFGRTSIDRQIDASFWNVTLGKHMLAGPLVSEFEDCSQCQPLRGCTDTVCCVQIRVVVVQVVREVPVICLAVLEPNRHPLADLNLHSECPVQAEHVPRL